MDYDFFENMTKNEAEAFLENFLRVESCSISDLIFAAKQEGIVADFSIESISVFLKWNLKKVKTFPKQIDSSLPGWIKESNSYLRSLVEFDEPSKIFVLRAAFYLGESFNKYSDKLYWSIGNCETAIKYMPVVTGFIHNMELAPILVVNNVFLRVLAHDAPNTDIDKAINTWLSFTPTGV